MKTVPSILTAVLFSAAFASQAQTQSAAPVAAQPETTAPTATPNPEAIAPASTAATSTETTAATDPKMTDAAMRARASAMRRPGSHMAAAGRPSSTPGFKDGITVRDGKVVATESGRSTFLADTASMKTITGLTANGQGVVTRADGTTQTLKEGDYMSLTGRYTSAEEVKEHRMDLKENLKEDRKKAAKRARSPLGRL